MIEGLAIGIAAAVYGLASGVRFYLLHSAAKRRVAKWTFPPLPARETDQLPF